LPTNDFRIVPSEMKSMFINYYNITLEIIPCLKIGEIDNSLPNE